MTPPLLTDRQINTKTKSVKNRRNEEIFEQPNGQTYTGDHAGQNSTKYIIPHT
jgi:hypothetical protein